MGGAWDYLGLFLELGALNPHHPGILKWIWDFLVLVAG